MIVVIMLFQDSNKNIQMVVALMGLFVFTILHVNVKPYDAFVHDKLEILSLLVSQVTLFIGLLANFFKEDQNSDKRTMTETEASSLNYTLGAVIALVNLLFVVYFVLNLIFHVYFFMPKSVRTRLNRCCGCFCRRCKRKYILFSRYIYIIIYIDVRNPHANTPFFLYPSLRYTNWYIIP